MKSLPNYLRTHRKRIALTQEEAGFLIGLTGMNKGVRVCRDENFTCVPSLKSALAYQVVYGHPVHELFAGLFQDTSKEVIQRARFLMHKKNMTPQKRELLARLANKPSSHP